jgi:hypothetical protein
MDSLHLPQLTKLAEARSVGIAFEQGGMHGNRTSRS